MILKHITVTMGNTVNCGDYNSARAEVTLEARLESSDSYDGVCRTLKEMVALQLSASVARARMELRGEGLPKPGREGV